MIIVCSESCVATPSSRRRIDGMDDRIKAQNLRKTPDTTRLGQTIRRRRRRRPPRWQPSAGRGAEEDTRQDT